VLLELMTVLQLQHHPVITLGCRTCADSLQSNKPPMRRSANLAGGNGQRQPPSKEKPLFLLALRRPQARRQTRLIACLGLLANNRQRLTAYGF